MKNILNKIADFIRYSRIAPTYIVTYAPADSRNPHLPIQKYHIIEHPRKLAWKSQAQNRLFTALSAKDENQFNAFRADRVLSVNFSGWKLLTPEVNKKVDKTLTTPFVPLVLVAN
jgi:hypothetical protein